MSVSRPLKIIKDYLEVLIVDVESTPTRIKIPN